MGCEKKLKPSGNQKGGGQTVTSRGWKETRENWYWENQGERLHKREKNKTKAQKKTGAPTNKKKKTQTTQYKHRG